MGTFDWAEIQNNRPEFLNTLASQKDVWYPSSWAWHSFSCATTAPVTLSVQLMSWLTCRWLISNYSLKTKGNTLSAGSLDMLVTASAITFFSMREGDKWSRGNDVLQIATWGPVLTIRKPHLPNSVFPWAAADFLCLQQQEVAPYDTCPEYWAFGLKSTKSWGNDD